MRIRCAGVPLGKIFYLGQDSVASAEAVARLVKVEVRVI